MNTLYPIYADLIDDDITDDVKCVRTIYEEHEGLSGNGFNAWLVLFPFQKLLSRKGPLIF